MRKNKTKTVGLAEDVREQIKIALDAEMRTAGPQEDYSDPALTEKTPTDYGTFKAKLVAPIRYLNESLDSFDPAWATTEVVKHCWGYRVPQSHKVGEIVYVQHNPEWDYPHEFEGKTVTTHYNESWTVYLNGNQVVLMSTEAAKKFLKTLRTPNGQPIMDDGEGEKRRNRYQWEINR